RTRDRVSHEKSTDTAGAAAPAARDDRRRRTGAQEKQRRPLASSAPTPRRIVHFNITEHPTAAWTAQQVIDAFPMTRRRAGCCAIGTRPTARWSASEWRGWVFGGACRGHPIPRADAVRGGFTREVRW